jgi:hypothetical protein
LLPLILDRQDYCIAANANALFLPVVVPEVVMF